MKTFNQKKFNEFILKNKIIGFFEKPIVLKSGRTSHWYVNWRNITEDVFLADLLSDFILSFIKSKKLKPNCIFGVPEGATKIAILSQYKLAKNSKNYGPKTHVLAMGRGKPKEHGELKDRYFLGVPKGKIIVLEDVTTTGSSLLETINVLKKIKNIKIIAAISLTNRMETDEKGESVQDLIEKAGVKYYQMSNTLELLPLAIKKFKPKRAIVNKIKEEFEKYGVLPLKIL